MKKKLITAAAAAPVAPTRRRTQTDAQAAQNATVAMLGKLWNSLSDDDKSTWVTMSQQLHSSSASNGTIGVQSKVSAYLTFISANTATYASSGILLHQAPPTPTAPPPLPPCLLNATYSANAGLQLSLMAPTYPTHVLVYGAAPVPAGQNIYKKKGAFKLLGGLLGLNPSNDLSVLYNAKFRCTGAGSKIAIKLVAVSFTGVRSAELFVSSVTTAAAAAAAVPAETEAAHRKAA